MKIEDINIKINEFNKLRKLLMLPINSDDTVEEKIFKKYLELESVSKVAEYINGLGYRINKDNKSRKYIANDISSVILSRDTKIKNNELKSIVIKLFKGNKKGLNSRKW